MTKIKMPNQPLAIDSHGRVRFAENPIVEYMLEAGSIDMNKLARWCGENEIDPEYQAQFAQLIGYSLDGWGTLSYVTDEKWDSVEEIGDED